MMKLFKNGLFPTENICYKVFQNLIQYYSLENSKAMRYSEDVKKFWYLGKRLFHNRFLEYMRGPGNKGKEIPEQRSTDINFPVPHNLQNSSTFYI